MEALITQPVSVKTVFREPVKKSFPELIIKRTVVFFFGLSLLNVFLYALGTKQVFMDTTQVILLHSSMSAGLLLGLTSGYGSILVIRRLVQKRPRYIRELVGYILSGVFGFMVTLLGAFIVALTGGNIV